MYARLPAFVLGFHGCDKSVRDEIIIGRQDIAHSNKAYDWLGHGAYFWENDAKRALEWAEEKNYPNPAVVGAVIDLGNCLNLVSREYIEVLKDAYATLQELSSELPINKNKLKNLDCAVISFLHEIYDKKGQPFDSVRGAFIEGEPVYPDAGFYVKTHIQICVRNPRCIKGFFDLRSTNS